MPSLSTLLASPSLPPKYQYLGCWHTRTSWMSWVMESVKPCVYTLNMDDVLWRILNWITIYRFLPIFHWLQLANLMCCPLHDSRLTNDSYYVLFTTWSQWCGTHFEVIFHTCMPCHEIQSTVDLKLHVWLANPFTLHPLSLSMHCSITAIEVSVETKCLLWYISAIYTLPHMNTSTCPATVWCWKAQSPGASHSSALHFCAFLLWTTAAFTCSPQGFQFPNVANIMMSAH